VGALGRKGRLDAIATLDRDNFIHLYSFDGRRTCRVGPIAKSNESSVRSIADVAEDILPYEVQLEDGDSELHVIDADCHGIISPLKNTKLIGNPASYDPTSLVLLTETNQLILLNAASRKQRVLARSVTYAVQSSTNLYTLENGTVTIRNRKLEKLRSVGSRVTEMLVDGSNSRVAFVDRNGLSLLLTDERDPIFLDKNACHIDWADASPTVNAVQYFTNCNDITLVVNLASIRRRVELPDNSVKPVSVRNFGNTSNPDWVLSYFVKSDSSSTEDPKVTDSTGNTFTAFRRFIGRIDETAAFIGRARPYRSFSSIENGGAFLWLDPGSAKSRLVTWSPKSSSEYVKHVTDFAYSPSPMRALIKNEHGEDLYRVFFDEQPKLIQKNAYGVGKFNSTGSLLFSSVENKVGSVSILQSDQTLPELLFSKALIPTASLIWEGSSAIALEDFDLAEMRGRVCVRLVVSADTFCESNVTGFIPTYRPGLGVAYVKQVGDKSTLYWAEAR
jgi:hypothetical protein